MKKYLISRTHIYNQTKLHRERTERSLAEALSDESVRNVNLAYFYDMDELKKLDNFKELMKKDIKPTHLVDKKPQALITIIDRNQLEYFKKFPSTIWADGTFRVNNSTETLINFMVKVSSHTNCYFIQLLKDYFQGERGNSIPVGHVLAGMFLCLYFGY